MTGSGFCARRDTPQYREFEERWKDRTTEEEKKLGVQLMAIFREFGGLREQDPASGQAQALVEKLQAYISEHFYTCTKQVLSGLGKMYTGGGDFTKNIDEAGGPGTAEFVDRAIRIYCN